MKHPKANVWQLSNDQAYNNRNSRKTLIARFHQVSEDQQLDYKTREKEFIEHWVDFLSLQLELKQITQQQFNTLYSHY